MRNLSPTLRRVPMLTLAPPVLMLMTRQGSFSPIGWSTGATSASRSTSIRKEARLSTRFTSSRCSASQMSLGPQRTVASTTTALLSLLLLPRMVTGIAWSDRLKRLPSIKGFSLAMLPRSSISSAARNSRPSSVVTSTRIPG